MNLLVILTSIILGVDSRGIDTTTKNVQYASSARFVVSAANGSVPGVKTLSRSASL